jgi:hypothetical protein
MELAQMAALVAILGGVAGIVIGFRSAFWMGYQLGAKRVEELERQVEQALVRIGKLEGIEGQLREAQDTVIRLERRLGQLLSRGTVRGSRTND